MSFTVNTLQVPFYTQRVPLEGTNYQLTFTFNQRGNYWQLSIATEDGTDLVNGIKLVCGFPLLHRFAVNNGLPPGELFCLTTTSDDSPPGLMELGQGFRCELTYFTAEEIAQALAGTLT